MKYPDFGQRERERKVVEIVRSFLLAFRAFRRLYGEYRNGSLRFSDLAKLADNRGQSILFTLKENCHSLFRRNEAGASEKEQIFDLTIGSLFHLAMKMREDLYQLEFYGPKYTQLSAKREERPDRQSLAHQFQGLISRARVSLQEGITEMDLLFNEVLPQFQDLLGEYRDNGLLLRFLMEEKGLLQEVWGEKALEEVFDRLYGPNSSQPDRIAGESYFQSSFYSQASRAFSRALEKNPADEEIQFMHHLSQGLEQFYSFALLPALKSLEKCLSLGVKKELLEECRGMISTVCQRIEQEFPGRRKSDQYHDLAKRTQVIQRELEKTSPGRSAQAKKE
jgi:tetratricopeptide (TPR) repeat protein